MSGRSLHLSECSMVTQWLRKRSATLCANPNLPLATHRNRNAAKSPLSLKENNNNKHRYSFTCTAVTQQRQKTDQQAPTGHPGGRMHSPPALSRRSGLRAEDLTRPGLVFCAGVQMCDLHLHRLHLQILGWDPAHLVCDLISLHRNILPLNAERKKVRSRAVKIRIYSAANVRDVWLCDKTVLFLNVRKERRNHEKQ